MMTMTRDRLRALRLSAMADAYVSQHQDAGTSALGFDERFSMLVDAEQLFRDNRALTRRLKEAKLRLPHACLEDLDYASRRGLDWTVIRQLAVGRWIVEHHNVLITGATGVGKTYLACALGQQACRQGHRVIYRRLPRLFADLALAHADGSYIAFLARLARVDVLVLDDWGLGAVTLAPPRPARDPRGPRWHAVDRHHEPAATRALARLFGRPNGRRRDPRSTGPSGPSLPLGGPSRRKTNPPPKPAAD